MILIEKVEYYGNELLAAIPELKTFLVVLDDSQINKELSDISEDDNLILVGFIPSHKTEGNNQDDVQNRDMMLWLVLNKVDRKAGQEAFIASFKKCQLAAKAIQAKMLDDKPRFDGACSLMRQLEVATIQIDPLQMSGCDGYEINYQLKTPIY